MYRRTLSTLTHAIHVWTLNSIFCYLDSPWTSENSSFENLLVGEKTAIDLDRQRKKQKNRSKKREKKVERIQIDSILQKREIAKNYTKGKPTKYHNHGPQ